MNNKSAGTRFEKEFADILADHWFWVHLFKITGTDSHVM